MILSSKRGAMKIFITFYKRDQKGRRSVFMVKNQKINKKGYLYAHFVNEDSGMELIKRFKIRNLGEIKEVI
jgi:hypothetical protein